jgi:hypothetical protein
MERSSFSWTAGIRQAAWRHLTHVVDEPTGVGVTLTVDTRRIAMDTVFPHRVAGSEIHADVRFPGSAVSARHH